MKGASFGGPQRPGRPPSTGFVGAFEDDEDVDYLSQIVKSTPSLPTLASPEREERRRRRHGEGDSSRGALSSAGLQQISPTKREGFIARQSRMSIHQMDKETFDRDEIDDVESYEPNRKVAKDVLEELVEGKRWKRHRLNVQQVSSYPSYGEAVQLVGSTFPASKSTTVPEEEEVDGDDEYDDIQAAKERLEARMLDSLERHESRQAREADLLKSYKDLVKEKRSHVAARRSLREKEEKRIFDLEMKGEAKIIQNAAATLERMAFKQAITLGVPPPGNSLESIVANNMMHTLADKAAENIGRCKRPSDLRWAHQLLSTSTAVQRPDSISRLSTWIQRACLYDELELTGKDVREHEVLEIAREPRLQRVHSLKLSGNQLRYIPEGIPKCLPCLRLLDVSQNKLHSVPLDWNQLIDLHVLNLSYNVFESIDMKVVSKMESLRELCLAGNCLTKLDERVGRLKKLEKLVIDNNRLVLVPGSLSDLISLRYLDLSFNALESLATMKPYVPVQVQAIEEEDDGEWDVVVDEASGQVVQFNAKTGKSRRQSLDGLRRRYDGVGLLDREQVISTLMQKRYQSHSQEMGEETWSHPSQEAELLQEGWEELFDHESGYPYYYHTETGESTWTKPVSLSLDLTKVVGGAAHLAKDRETKMQRRRALERANMPEWVYWINAETGDTEWGNYVTEEIVIGRIPRDIDKLGNLKLLKTLKLNYNRLTDLPASIGDLKLLERLEANNNRIRNLPESLGGMQALRVLSICENRLESLPASVGQLDKLEEALLSGNSLSDVPDTIAGCTSLKVLDLCGNQFQVLNDVVGTLSGLEKVLLFNNATLDAPPKHILGKGTKHILRDCRERMQRRVRGNPPPPTVRPNIGVAGEHLVIEGRFHQDLKRDMDRAEETGILKLHFKGLRSLPERVARMHMLRELRISGNLHFVEIPAYLNRLRNVQELHFPGNSLTCLPAPLSFWQPLQKIVAIDVSDNAITELPPSLSVLGSLRSLSVSGNRISELHGALFSSPLRESLEILKLENNQLSSLPDEICLLENLRELFLTHNKLEELPEQIGSLKKLERLYTSNNALQALPRTINQLGNLRIFQVAHNYLHKVDGNFAKGPIRFCLELLNVQANRIAELPTSFKELRNLKQLLFDLNPIKSPPQEIHGKPWTIAELLDYCTEREKRFEMIEKLLSNHPDFGFDRTKLAPTCNGAVVDGEGYLDPDDVPEIDILLDHFVNGNYYDYTLSCFEIAQQVRNLFYARKNAVLRRVLDDLLELLERAQDHKLLPRHVFSKDVWLPFGRDFEQVPCYLFKVDCLFDPIQPLGAVSGSDHGSETEDDASEKSVDEDDKDANDSEEHGSEASTPVKKASKGPQKKPEKKKNKKRKSSETESQSEEEKEDDDDDDDLSSLASESVSGVSSNESIDSPTSVDGGDKVRPSIIESVRSLPGSEAYSFTFSRSNVALALRDYRGPYGRVSLCNLPFSFEGEEDLGIPPLDVQVKHRKVEESTTPRTLTAPNEQGVKELGRGYVSAFFAALRRMKGEKPVATRLLQDPATETGRSLVFKEVDDGRHVVALAQLLFKPEEAERREQEEKEIEQAVEAAHSELHKWLGTSRGKDRLLRAAIHQNSVARDVFRKVSQQFKEASANVKDAQANEASVRERVKSFEKGEPIHMHRFESMKEARRALIASQEEVEKATEKAKSVEAQFEAAQRRKKLRLGQMKQDVIQRIMDRVASKAAQRQIRKNRKTALEKGLRRPWDGVHGKDFEIWKAQYKRARADKGEEEHDSEDEEEKQKRKLAILLQSGEQGDEKEAAVEPYESDFEELEESTKQ